MRPFITDTTKNRQKAENDMKAAVEKHAEEDLADAKSRKAFYKLFGNSVSGKTFQNDLKFHDTTFVRNKQQFLKATMGRYHMDNVIIGQNLVEVKCKKKKYEIRSPKYLGSAILWNSKMLMLDWIYNCLWVTYPNAEIMYSDTDSDVESQK